MNIEQLIAELQTEPDDVIELLEKITDDNLEALKARGLNAELSNLRTIAIDILTMLQTTASGGHLVDVSRVSEIIRKIDGV